MNAAAFHVVMRADASTQIGLGHVRRCLSLAQALQRAGASVALVSRDLGIDVRPLAQQCGVQVHVLPTPGVAELAADDAPHAAWAQVGWQRDVQETLAAIGDSAPDWLVVDHYAFDAKWHRAVVGALAARLAAIDDVADRALEALVVVDQNFHVDHRGKYAGRLGPGVTVLGGPRFALLSPVYETAQRYVWRDTVRSIGIFMGGIDRDDWSSRVLHACREQAAFTGPIEIATTRSNPNLAALRAVAQQHAPTTVTVDADDLSRFFARHDLQIGAGGGATWERCCVAVPALVLVCADNQRAAIDLAAAGVVATIERALAASLPEIGRAVRELIDDPARRRRLADAAGLLVDGLGARRVALRLAADRLEVRPADPADARRIYEWRNHAATRRVSRDQDEIGWPAHCDWLRAALANPDRILLIGAVGSIPVGVIRFDMRQGGVAEVSLYLDPALHGLALGPALLTAGERHARSQRPDLRRFSAVVLEENATSQHLFAGAGYVREDRVRWSKEP